MSKIQLTSRRQGKLVNHFLGPETVRSRVIPGKDLGQPFHQAEIRFNHPLDTASAYYDHDRRAIHEARPMHLRYGGGSQQLSVKLRKDLLRRVTQVLLQLRTKFFKFNWWRRILQ